MFADSGLFGDNLLVWLVLALGAAMVVGYGLALTRPPPNPKGRRREQPQAPFGRSLLMIAIGALAVIWSLATLVKR